MASTGLKSQRNYAYDLVFKDVQVLMSKKRILSNVSGFAEPGSMLALMGPSGAGKTTLLNVLAGRGIPLASGTIQLNDQPLSKQLRRKISYVLQEDIFFSKLTVRETLMYTALLRLPGSMPHQDKLERIREVVQAVGIEKCLDTMIGGPMVNGISGGEKKRTSIACELLTNPALLMLDEPTSGLDSSTAHSLMMTLKEYMQTSGKTVIASIHQPSSQTFFLFNRVLLLCDGQVAYFGDCNKMLDYFSGLGLYNQPNYNPADFMLEKVSDSTSKEIILQSGAISQREMLLNQPVLATSKGSSTKATLCDNWNGLPNGKDNVVGDLAFQMTPVVKEFSNNNATYCTPNSSTVALCDATEEDTYFKEYEAKWPTDFWAQYCVLTRRNFKEALPEILSKWNCAQMLVVSIFCGLLWFQLDDSEESITKRQSVAFFMNTFWAFELAINAILAFSAERAVINKERSAGYYRLSAYYFAKMTSELPLTLLLPTVFITIVFWVASLGDYVAFFKNWGVLLLSAFTAQSIGLFLGAAIMNMKMAMTAVNMFMLCSLLAGGFYLPDLPDWIAWTKYFSYIYYAFCAIISIQFNTAELRCLPENTTSYCAPIYSAIRSGAGVGVTNSSDHLFELSNSWSKTCKMESSSSLTAATLPGCLVLDSLNVSWPEWAYPLMLIAISISFRFMTYIILRFIRNPK